MANPFTKDFLIRCSNPDEAEAVLTLWREAGATPTVTDSAEHVRQALAGGSAWMLVAEVRGRLVGSLLASFDGWRGHLYRLAVHPDYRRRGIAHALVVEAGRRLEQRGAQRIIALVERDNPIAMAFWKAVGYQLDTRLVRFVRNREAFPSASQDDNVTR